MTNHKVVTVEVDSDIADLVPGFLKNRQDDVQRIQSLIDEENYESLRILGHNMKGSGRSYGFDRVSEIGEAIERASERGDLSDIRESAFHLRDYLDRVRYVTSDT